MKMRLGLLGRKGYAAKTLALALLMGMGWIGAATAQTIQPITWNVVGLDSNNVNIGPNVFPVGARVCNNTAAPIGATTWQARFNWVTLSSYIERTSPLTLPVGALAVGACSDVFHEVTVGRNAAAYEIGRAHV